MTREFILSRASPRQPHSLLGNFSRQLFRVHILMFEVAGQPVSRENLSLVSYDHAVQIIT